MTDPSQEPAGFWADISDSSMYQSYEDYSTTSSDYDDTRKPVGLGVISEILEAGEAAPGGMRLLDAGCGTGSYFHALQHQVSRLDGLEYNLGMLERAREKLNLTENVFLHRGSVLEMPYPDGSFDAVMFNQVIHHLDDVEGMGQKRWPHLRRALAESHRVLRPGGVLIINTCTQQQIRDGFWYAALIPDAVRRASRRYVPVEELYTLLRELDFDVRETETPVAETLFGARYFDLCGPFDRTWRNGDSMWALATEAELQVALERLRSLHETDEAVEFLESRDKLRQETGQCVFVQAWRAVDRKD